MGVVAYPEVEPCGAHRGNHANLGVDISDQHLASDLDGRSQGQQPQLGRCDAAAMTAEHLFVDFARAFDAGEIDEALAALDRLSTRPLDVADRARLCVAEGRVASDMGRPRAAVAAFESAISAAVSSAGPALDGRVSSAAVGSPAPGLAETVTEARVELARLAFRSGALDRAAAALDCSAVSATPKMAMACYALRVGLGDFEIVDDVALKADKLLASQGVGSAAMIAETAGFALVWAERHDESERLTTRLARLASGAGNLGPIPHILSVRALSDLRCGRYRNAAVHAEEAVRVADETGRPGLALLPTAVLAVAQAVRGEPSGCRVASARLVEAAARPAPENSGIRAEIPARAALGLLHLGLDEPELAVAQFEPLDPYVETKPWLLMWQMDYAEALARSGRGDEANSTVERFERELDRNRPGRAVAAAARVRALVSADDLDRVERLLARSERAARSVGNPFALGRTLLVRGRLRLGWGHDVAGSVDLDHAEAVFGRIGAGGWAAQVDAARRGMGVGAPAAVQPVVLTAQELRVAGLVATGKSNREVADALFVSARTIESHLGRIYRKLGLASRNQLIARADEWGLRDLLV